MHDLWQRTLWAAFKARFDGDCADLNQLKADLIAGRANRDFRLLADMVAEQWAALNDPRSPLTFDQAMSEMRSWTVRFVLTEDPQRVEHWQAIDDFLCDWEEYNIEQRDQADVELECALSRAEPVQLASGGCGYVYPGENDMRDDEPEQPKQIGEVTKHFLTGIWRRLTA